MTDTDDTTTIAVSRDTKAELDRKFDGSYDAKIRALLDEYERHRLVIEPGDDDRVAELIEEHA